MGVGERDARANAATITVAASDSPYRTRADYVCDGTDDGVEVSAAVEKIKTAGGTVKLMELIEEAQTRAAELVKQKNPDIADDELKNIARVVGIGALKYADLAQNRSSDYIFAWNKMLSMEGNTAPYMQYAYARVKSIFRKGGEESAVREFVLADDAERALGVKLSQFGETLDAVAATAMPNILCAYLFELAGAFMSFYEKCPVLKADGAVRANRLGLCELTARVIRQGLALLGIETLEQM